MYRTSRGCVILSFRLSISCDEALVIVSSCRVTPLRQSLSRMNSLTCFLVSSGLVTVCPMVRALSKISWSFPPGYVLSPKK